MHTVAEKRDYKMVNRTPLDADEVRRTDRERKAVQRSAGREIFIPDVVNPQRRERCEADPELFLKTYMPIKFKNPFCRHHIAMIDGLEECLHYSGWQAMAAPRGDGKSSISEGMIMRAIDYGFRHFPILIGATETDAQQRKASIAEVYQGVGSDGDLLLEDFPEICWPIRELGRSGRKGIQQTYNGEFTEIQWPSGIKAREMRFPIIEGSKASGAWLVIRGMEKGKVRGTKFGNDRPDLVVLDDVESQASARSEVQTAQIEEKIDREVTPLAGPNETLAIFMPCTIIAKGCIADRMTDPVGHPEYAAWMGQRHSLVIDWPECHEAEGEADLWAVYRRMWREDQLGGDRTGRRAHQYYLDNLDAMDAGCVVSNRYRFDSKACHDGSELQSSTIEGVMQFVAIKGDHDKAWATMNAEYQNQPDESNAPEGSDCSEDIIQRSVNGIPQGMCPPGTMYLTAGMDIHKDWIYWVIVAWVGSHGHIIAYGRIATYADDAAMAGDAQVSEGVKKAIFNALSEWRDTEAEGRPVYESGELKRLDRVFIDSRWMSDAVYSFVSESPRPMFMPVTGSGGQYRNTYRPPPSSTKDKKIGRFHYYAVRQNEHGGLWLIHVDSDYWVSHIQGGFVMTASHGKEPGMDIRDAMSLYGTDRMKHRNIANHIMNEEFVTVFKPGIGLTSNRVVKDRRNHWLDCLDYACAAGAHAGVQFGHMTETKSKRRPSGRVKVVGQVNQFAK